MFYLLDSTASSTSTSGSVWGMILIYVAFFAIMYFLLIRPQRKQQKQQEAMVNNIKIGDWVLLSDGMYGKVVNMVNDCLIVEFGTNKSVMIPVLKSQIASVQEPDLTQKKVDEADIAPTDSVVGDDIAPEDELDNYDKEVLAQEEKKKHFFKKKS